MSTLAWVLACLECVDFIQGRIQEVGNRTCSGREISNPYQDYFKVIKCDTEIVDWIPWLEFRLLTKNDWGRSTKSEKVYSKKLHFSWKFTKVDITVVLTIHLNLCLTNYTSYFCIVGMFSGTVQYRSELNLFCIWYSLGQCRLVQLTILLKFNNVSHLKACPFHSRN